MEEPDPIDIHVGERLKLQRMLKGLSQEELGNALGVTFQQIQKYEKGSNRISASALWKLAKKLNAPVMFFFSNLEGNCARVQSLIDEGAGPADIRFMQDYLSMPEKVRCRAREFMRALADAYGEQDAPDE